MAGKQIQRQQSHIDQQHKGPDANSESFRKDKGPNRVMPQEGNEHDCQVQKVPVNVLQNEREARFPSVVSLSLRCRTRWWIEKERSIVCLAIVVTGCPKPQRATQNQQRR